MPTVSVDLDDLETLVMTTGALKTVEEALNKRKSDPFVRAHLDFTDAHNRLAEQMRNARRSLNNKDTIIQFDETLTPEEEKFLLELDASTAGYFIYNVISIPNTYRYLHASLQAKGMIRRGNHLNFILWDNDERTQPEEDSRGFAIKLTDRGMNKVSAIRDRYKDRYKDIWR